MQNAAAEKRPAPAPHAADSTPDAAADGFDARSAMDRMYKLQRHFYDLTRKFYLLGRDRTIALLGLQPGDRLLELGCGTARNLIATARRFPQARLFGVDVSDEMLKTAAANLARAGHPGEVHLAQGDATSFDPQILFGEPAGFDRVLFSYSLSIIPPWEAAVDHALDLVRPGGEIHVVDFGGSEQMPSWFRGLLFKWLDLFGVHWKPEIADRFRLLESRGLGRLDIVPMKRGYCYRLVFTKVGG